MTCFDCGAEAPTTETEYTLIAGKAAWRCVRGTSGTGETVMEWRCPACWAEYRRKSGSAMQAKRHTSPPVKKPYAGPDKR